MGHRAACVAAALAVACSDAEAPSEREVVLRVGAAHGLGDFVPSPHQTGATAYAMDLVYEPVIDYAHVDSVDGNKVFLEVVAERPTAAVLAENLVYQGLESASADNGMIVAQFVSANAAADAAERFRHGTRALDLGPFAFDSQDDAIELRSRGGTFVDTIQIRSLDTGELWRRLLGRDVDVIPTIDAVHRDQFTGMRTVRALPLEKTGYMMLVFNSDAPALSGRSVRRRLASFLDPRAIAAVACGEKKWAIDLWRPARATDENVALPEQLRVAVLETDSSAVLASRVIRHQLNRIGVDVRVETLSLDGLVEQAFGSFDILLLPFAPDPDQAISAFGPHAPSYLRFPDDEYTAAHAAGDVEGMRAALAREVPVVPLYEMRQFAAVDARFCGGEPESAYSWGWLADLYPCDAEAP